MSDLRIEAIRLSCVDVDAALDFYRQAFGCRDDEARPPLRALRLGRQSLEFVAAAFAARADAPSPSTAFQHCAIVVSDMGAAMAALQNVGGWSAISLKGPERLPQASGGVTAFKFRDPDGHPLEFLEFPKGHVPDPWATVAGGPCLGIDHSAITVADADRSLAFYEAIGFRLEARHLNEGEEQGRLDGVGGYARVEVLTLMPQGGAPPHLELLCYHEPAVTAQPAPDGSTGASVLMISRAFADGTELRDPDGHRWQQVDL